ncbi:MAG: hypothetical protein ABII74_06545 [Elusimicrobiota bacterium]
MWQEILYGIFGIGFIGTVLMNYWIIQQNRKLNKENRIYSNLQLRINNLYAPLYHLVLGNENTIKLMNKYGEEYDKRFKQKIWSQDKDTQGSVQKESSELIKVGNDLKNNFVLLNNEKILDLIDHNSAYIDSDDRDIFAEFKQHHERSKTEFDDNGKLKISLETYNNLGNVSFFPPAFAERVKEKYNKKIDEFNSLLSK